MSKKTNYLAKEHLGSAYKDLQQSDKSVIDHIADSDPITEDVNKLFHEQLSFGQRLADKISEFGGSWTFIIIFLSILIVWILLNSFFLIGPQEVFDPYPYILLNLMLSTIAALQAPVIMMSQNRQTQKDRLDIVENYKVSLKTELGIALLHQKIDELRAAIDKQ